MSKDFDHLLRQYARIPLQCLWMHEVPRRLFIQCEVEPNSATLAALIAEEAYRSFHVPYVDVIYYDPRVRKQQFLHAPEEMKLKVPSWVQERSQDAICRSATVRSNNDAAYLRLDGQSAFGVYDSEASKYAAKYQSAWRQMEQPLMDLRSKALVPWNLCCVATENWARQVGVSVEELWRLLFKVTGADQSDPLGYVMDTMKTLERRRDKLNALKIQKLRFQSPLTDLTVGLSSKSKWQGGTKETDEGPAFIANWPTYEVFTTPDWRTVEGRVAITRPTVVGGRALDNLSVGFEKGRIQAVLGDPDAVDEYSALINQDVGASQVGEVALVGLDSPAEQLGRVMFETMIDENARCHIATGGGYESAIYGGPQMSPEELAAVGCNDSKTHHDVMISDENTTVKATFDAGVVGTEEITLIENGHWTPSFK